MRIVINSIKVIPVLVLLLSNQKIFSQNKPNAEGVYEKVEVEASFPGGDAAWLKYVSDAMNKANFDKFKNSDQGTCRVRFIVDKKGYINNAEAVTMKKSRLAKLAIEIIENGPRWHPAQQDGKFVNAYREQPVSFHFSKK